MSNMLGWIGVLGALGVTAGAFGAHGLKNVPEMTDRRLEAWKTGATYHMIHTVAMLALTTSHAVKNPWPCRLWIGGVLFFSGSLYAYGYTGQTKFGAIAPIGGTMFIAGWAAILLG